MQRGALGRTLESDRPALALELETGGPASQGLDRLVCEMEMVILPPHCARAGGNETVSFSLLAEPRRKQVPNKC